MNKKLWWGVVIIVVLVLWVALGNNSKKQDSSSVIKIGLVAPMTGPGAVFGNSIKKGIELAHADTKDTKYRYEVILEDDGTNPAQSASAAQKLINVDKVQAIISMTSGTGNAVKPIAAGAKIPHVCVCSDVSVADAPYNFTNLLLPDDEATGWLSEAKKRGVQTMVIIHQNQQGINAIVDSIEKLAPNFGIKVLYKERFDPSLRDFKTILSKARVFKPDVFYVVSFPPSLDIIGQELQTLGIRNISSSAAFGISAKPELFEGLWYNDGNFVDVTFRSRFEKAFPGVRFNVRSAPYGYDIFRMFVKAFESGEDVTAYLSNLTEYDGMAGKITKTAGSRNFHSQPGLWIIKNGKAEPLAN